MATDAQRAHLRLLMLYLLEHEPQVHYAQQRPMDATRLSERQLHARLAAGGGISMDCSEAVTALCKWAGLHDPNGRHYDGLGFTGTLLANLPHYADPARARLGALVVFGPAPGEHVAMVAWRGADPMLWSHGGESGPRFVRFSAARAAHRRPATFLSIAEL